MQKTKTKMMNWMMNLLDWNDEWMLWHSIISFNAGFGKSQETKEKTMTDAERIEKLTSLVNFLLDNSVPASGVDISTYMDMVERLEELEIVI